MSRLCVGRAEWCDTVDRGGVAWLDQPDHIVVVSVPGSVQAVCSCGWRGPDRTGDVHRVALVVDDTDQHCHRVGVKCTQHPCQVCSDWGVPG